MTTSDDAKVHPQLRDHIAAMLVDPPLLLGPSFKSRTSDFLEVG